MRSLGSRRAALATGVAAVAAVALAGCSAGQVAETANKRPSNMGVNAANSDGSILIRNLAVQYPGTTGYAAGENAPLELGLFNQTRQSITVLVSSRPAPSGAGETEGAAAIVSARSVGLTGGPAASAKPAAEPSAEPSASGPQPEPGVKASASPSASAAGPAGPVFRPARIEVAPLSSVTFLPGDIVQLQAIGLAGKLAPGQALNLVFEFSNGANELVLQAPVGIPLTPASRGPGLESHEE
ncbi:hypothetical protein ACIBSW_05860 [Actinoplanes sp. NPDC049668]|uniref:hypothetical protein n=1 Tax=unclassified Actinoplanes TaxID=2626549 RepID=UPI0033B15CF0